MNVRPQHQNVSFAQLIEWGKTNPNMSKNIAPIGIQNQCEIESSSSDNTLGSIGLTEFESITLTPSGTLGAIAWMSDPAYPYLSVRARQSHLREMATRLQELSDKLTNTTLSRKRRKIHDGIGALANTGAVKPADTLELFSCIGQMLELQIIFVQMSKVEEREKEDDKDRGEVDADVEAGDYVSDEKTIYFSSNPVNWSIDRKTYVVDYYGRWIATPQTDNAFKTLVNWIEDIEVHGWIVQWHIDALQTKEAIVADLSLRPSWRPEHSKLKKDILARRLAKYNTINAVFIIAQQ